MLPCLLPSPPEVSLAKPPAQRLVPHGGARSDPVSHVPTTLQTPSPCCCRQNPPHLRLMLWTPLFYLKPEYSLRMVQPALRGRLIRSHALNPTAPGGGWVSSFLLPPNHQFFACSYAVRYQRLSVLTEVTHWQPGHSSSVTKDCSTSLTAFPSLWTLPPPSPINDLAKCAVLDLVHSSLTSSVAMSSSFLWHLLQPLPWLCPRIWHYQFMHCLQNFKLPTVCSPSAAFPTHSLEYPYCITLTI